MSEIEKSQMQEVEKSQIMSVGVVIRRLPGTTRWQKWLWKPVAVLPGAGEAEWKILREQEDVIEYHATTLPLELYRSDTESYVHELCTRTPSLYVVMRPEIDETVDFPLEITLITASSHEGQDYCESDEDIVEKIPMPAVILEWVEQFVARHHEEEAFVKRKRKKTDFDKKEDGIGDSRIVQLSDVYRTPSSRKENLQ